MNRGIKMAIFIFLFIILALLQFWISAFIVDYYENCSKAKITGIKSAQDGFLSAPLYVYETDKGDVIKDSRYSIGDEVCI